MRRSRAAPFEDRRVRRGVWTARRPLHGRPCRRPARDGAYQRAGASSRRASGTRPAATALACSGGGALSSTRRSRTSPAWRGRRGPLRSVRQSRPARDRGEHAVDRASRPKLRGVVGAVHARRRSRRRLRGRSRSDASKPSLCERCRTRPSRCPSSSPLRRGRPRGRRSIRGVEPWPDSDEAGAPRRPPSGRVRRQCCHSWRVC